MSVPAEVDGFLASYEPAVRKLALQLRTLILKVAPDAEEKVHRPWKTIGYRAGAVFCAISPHSARVNLQFHRGSELDDPDGLLEGAGKSMRHVKIEVAAEIKRPAMRKLIRSAADHARG